MRRKRGEFPEEHRLRVARYAADRAAADCEAKEARFHHTKTAEDYQEWAAARRDRTRTVAELKAAEAAYQAFIDDAVRSVGLR